MSVKSKSLVSESILTCAIQIKSAYKEWMNHD